MDYAGTSVLVISTVALLLALSIGGHEVSWTSPVLLALASLGIAGFALLPKVELKTPDPLISAELIEEPVIWRASLTVLLFAAVLFGLIVQLPLFSRQRLAQAQQSLDCCLFLSLSRKWLFPPQRVCEFRKLGILGR